MNVSANKWTGVLAALMAALLFGASTPFAKQVLPETNAALFAGLLYLASGLGLLIIWLVRRWLNRARQETPLKRTDAPWLAGAIFSGGIIGPILLLVGLKESAAANASLLLNLEGVFTAVLAWVVFKERFDYRIALGIGLIAVGGMVLAWGGRPGTGMPWGSLAIMGACLAWAVDNNLTRRVSARDPLQIAMLKGLAAGTVNVSLGMALGAHLPKTGVLAQMALIGLLGYGISLTLFVLALRHIGAARTGAYFSTAPFVGAIIAIIFFGDRLNSLLVVAGLMMAVGVWLHLAEHRAHWRQHEVMEHDHLHYHDDHHQHGHGPNDPAGEPHAHWHRHEGLAHAHPHPPDIHHQRGH